MSNLEKHEIDQVFCDELKKLDVGSEVKWNSAHVSQEHPFCGGWIDIYVESICPAIGMNWAWTIDSLKNEDIENRTVLNFHVPYDSLLQIEMKEEGRFFYPLQAQLVSLQGEYHENLDHLIKDEEMDFDVEKPYTWEWFHYQPSTQTRKDFIDDDDYDDDFVDEMGVIWSKTSEGTIVRTELQWSVMAISQALAEWSENVLGHSLTFSFDADSAISPMHQELIEDHADYLDGDKEKPDLVEVAPNIFAPKELLEKLEVLNDPAALEEINNLASRMLEEEKAREKYENEKISKELLGEDND